MKITDNCTGCSACANICPHSAISLKEQSGFYKAVVDESLCVKCGLCIKSCPQNNEFITKPIKAILCESKCSDDIITSTSGGVFILIAREIIERNGVVFGVEIDNNMDVFHNSAKTIGECEKFKKSKYVQSNLKNTFKEAKEYLDEKKDVLFTGTPCQIAGLQAFLGKEYKNLYTIDFLCHGVPSHQLFLQEIYWLNKKYHGPITDVTFRRKGPNKVPLYSLDFNNKKYKRIKLDCVSDPYLNAFLNSNSLNDCCYSCKYSNFNKLSSITVGDSWRNKDNYKSLVIINDDNGSHLVDIIKDKIRYSVVPFDVVLDKKSNLSNPSNVSNSEIYLMLKDFSNYERYADTYCKSRMYKKHQILKIIPEYIRYKLK